MSIKNTFLRLLKSKKKAIKKQEDDLNKFKSYIEKEWFFLKDYGLKFKYDYKNNAEFSTQDNRFYFRIYFNSIPKYKRTDSSGFYKNFETNSVKEFIDDMIDFI